MKSPQMITIGSKSYNVELFYSNHVSSLYCYQHYTCEQTRCEHKKNPAPCDRHFIAKFG